MNVAKLAVPASTSDHTLGGAEAPVTLVEYGDYQCPTCAAAHPLVKILRTRFGDDLRFVFRHFPLTQVHSLAESAAEVAEAAHKFDKFWAMHDWLFENQDLWSIAGVPALLLGASDIGIDQDALQNALLDGQIAVRIRNDFRGGVRSGISVTPSFFVNGERHESDLQRLVRVIDEKVKRSFVDNLPRGRVTQEPSSTRPIR